MKEINTPLISIIVPVYNVEQYLPKCIDSILAQTYTNFEVLLINDGSPDNCGAICDRYAEQDNRIRVFHKENGGVSSARNMGIGVAQGKYVTFVDGDDTIINTTLIHLLKIIDELESDIILLNSIDDRNVVLHKFVLSPEKMLRGIKVFREGFMRGSVCGCLFNRNFLFNNSIYFRESLANGEDTFFMWSALYNACKVIYFNQDFYKVYKRMGSASRSWNQNKIQKTFDNIIKETNYSRINLINNELLSIFRYQMISNLCDKMAKKTTLSLFLRNTYNYKSIYKFKYYKIQSYGLSVKFRMFMLEYMTSLYLILFYCKNK